MKAVLYIGMVVSLRGEEITKDARFWSVETGGEVTERERERDRERERKRQREGRVGWDDAAFYCVLLYEGTSEIAFRVSERKGDISRRGLGK